MTVFPDSIRIRVVNADTVNPVQNVVVNLMLFANDKNNYGFALPVTNVAGITEISKEWLSTRVDEIHNIFIMDYSSRLDDCQPRFEIKMYDKEMMVRLIKAQKQYQEVFRISQDQINNYEHADNYQYRYAVEQFELTGESSMGVEFKVNSLPITE